MTGKAQLSERNASSSIKQSIKKLNTLSSVLYIAAHPDDENTRLISYLSNEELTRTAYLSLTRGDGGQNLSGSEKGDALGLLRTQELLEARKIDGGEQYFTRAVDFGYSKSSEESFEIWGRNDILHDVVLVIRQFQPDVIITRFPPTKYAGHGHHKASAILAEEAFKAAADPTQFPAQLKERGLSIWQTKRLYFNTSTWWVKDLEETSKNSDEYLKIDIGTYNPILGISYGEMAAESRSMHKSQGFGSARQRGSKTEFLQYKLGEKAKNNSLMDGINTSWSRIGKEGNEIGELISKAYQQYSPDNPSACIDLLLIVKKKMTALNKNNVALLTKKMEELDDLILRLCGVYFETTSAHPVATPGEEVQLKITTVNRSNRPINLENIIISEQSFPLSLSLLFNELIEKEQAFAISESMHFSTPYWLNHPHKGAFKVDDPTLIGMAENHDFKVRYQFNVAGQQVIVHKPIQYRWVDREKGELYRPFVLLPAATANIKDPVYIFSAAGEKEIEVRLTAHAAELNGEVKLTAPKNWTIRPSSIPFQTSKKGEEKVFKFSITPPKEADNTSLNAIVTIGTKSLNHRLDQIEYDHVSAQSMLSPSSAKLIRLNIQKKGEKVGYVMGAGDDVPESLEQIGYKITAIHPDELAGYDLTPFKAVIFGIRAFNTDPTLIYAKEKLMEYVKSRRKYDCSIQYKQRN